eukprot:9259302-Pyramimonas_sp.AAC.1
MFDADGRRPHEGHDAPWPVCPRRLAQSECRSATAPVAARNRHRPTAKSHEMPSLGLHPKLQDASSQVGPQALIGPGDQRHHWPHLFQRRRLSQRTAVRRWLTRRTMREMEEATDE